MEGVDVSLFSESTRDLVPEFSSDPTTTVYHSWFFPSIHPDPVGRTEDVKPKSQGTKKSLGPHNQGKKKELERGSNEKGEEFGDVLCDREPLSIPTNDYSLFFFFFSSVTYFPCFTHGKDEGRVGRTENSKFENLQC